MCFMDGDAKDLGNISKEGSLYLKDRHPDK